MGSAHLVAANRILVRFLVAINFHSRNIKACFRVLFLTLGVQLSFFEAFQRLVVVFGRLVLVLALGVGSLGLLITATKVRRSVLGNEFRRSVAWPHVNWLSPSAIRSVASQTRLLSILI